MAREENIYLMPVRGKEFQGGESQNSSKSSLVELTKTELVSLSGRDRRVEQQPRVLELKAQRRSLN